MSVVVSKRDGGSISALWRVITWMFVFTGTLHKRVYNASPAQCWVFHHHYDVVLSCSFEIFFFRSETKERTLYISFTSGVDRQIRATPLSPAGTHRYKAESFEKQKRLSPPPSRTPVSWSLWKTLLRAELNPEQPFIVSHLRHFQQTTNTEVGTFFILSEFNSKPAVGILLMGVNIMYMNVFFLF